MFRKPDSCNNDVGTGDINDLDKEDCLTAKPFGERTECDWEKTKEVFGIEQCARVSTEGGESATYKCVDTSGGTLSV